jgi:hypothetical protein
MLKNQASKAAADGSTGGVASVGYVEDAFEVRTKLAGFFSILSGRQKEKGNRQHQVDPD